MMTDPAMIAPAVMKPTKPYGYEKPDMTAAVMTINAVQMVVTAATNIDADIMLFMIVPFRRGMIPGYWFEVKQSCLLSRRCQRRGSC